MGGQSMSAAWPSGFHADRVNIVRRNRRVLERLVARYRLARRLGR
jgi:hypothetical protein